MVLLCLVLASTVQVTLHGLRTWAVAPGPRHLTIELPDLRRLRVELDVLPGETRRLELR